MLSALPVHPALLGLVDGIWSFTGDGRAQRILPDGCLDFVFDLEHGRASVVGAMSRAQLIAPPLGSRSFGVRFRPGQAARFIDAHASELLDTEAELSELTRVRALTARLQDAKTTSERHAALADVLLDARARTRPADARLELTLRAMRRAPGARTVRELSASLGLSERQFERRFLERVGIGPKRFLRVLRMDRALALAEHSQLSQAALAARAGYSDQPHFVREFRALTGLTPQALVHERRVGFVQGEPAHTG